MAGYVFITMQNESPFSLVLRVTEDEPEIWMAEMPDGWHLLCYEYFYNPKSIEADCLNELAMEGKKLKPGQPFLATPWEVLRVFIHARDDAMRTLNGVLNTQSQDKSAQGSVESDSGIDEARLLFDRAEESEFGSEQAFTLYQQSAKLGYKRAYIALARAYLKAWGVKKNLNKAMSWAKKLKPEDLEALDSYGRDKAGELFYSLASEYENGSDQAIPDKKRAMELTLQAAELGYELAYTSLASAYLVGDGVEKNLNSALEWALREIDAGIIYGYNHATTCFVEAGMKQQAENLWKRCFEEQTLEKISTACLRTYIKQAGNGFISIHPDIEKKFASLAESIEKLQQEMGVTIYDEEFAWLGVRDTCIVCSIPIAPETARKTEGKCVPCFIKGLS